MIVVWRLLQGLLWVLLLGFLALLLLPRTTQYDLLIVRGGSMEPDISVGSAVIVDRGARALELGDVASFRTEEGVVTHRVIAIESGGFVTRGDANPGPDVGVRGGGDVLGRVLFSVPFLGYVLHVMQLPFVFLTLLAFTGGSIVLSELRQIRRSMREIRGGATDA